MRTIIHHARIARSIAAAIIVALTVVACDGNPSDPGRSQGPLGGLRYAGVADSLGNGIPQPLTPSGVGSVVGTVIGPSAPGAGNDSLSVAPRIANVTIRIYPVVSDMNALPELGDEIASVTTDANGRFETPIIEAAPLGYVFTFTPPIGSVYAASWLRSNFWTGSNFRPWWITLQRLP